MTTIIIIIHTAFLCFLFIMMQKRRMLFIRLLAEMFPDTYPYVKSQTDYEIARNYRFNMPISFLMIKYILFNKKLSAGMTADALFYNRKMRTTSNYLLLGFILYIVWIFGVGWISSKFY